MFLLLLSRAYPHPKAFSAFGTATLPEEAGGAWEVGRRHSWDRWPHLTKGILQTMWHCVSIWSVGKEEVIMGRCLELMVFVSPSQLCVLWPCSPGDGWNLPAHGKQWINSFFCFACVCSFCFPNETVFSSTHQFFAFYPYDSLPSPTGGGLPEQLHGVWLLAGVKPVVFDRVSLHSPNQHSSLHAFGLPITFWGLLFSCVSPLATEHLFPIPLSYWRDTALIPGILQDRKSSLKQLLSYSHLLNELLAFS